MKNIPASDSVDEHLDGVRLYRDDLDRIVKLVGDAGLKVAIRDETVAFDSLDEVATVRGESPSSCRR